VRKYGTTAPQIVILNEVKDHVACDTITEGRPSLDQVIGRRFIVLMSSNLLRLTSQPPFSPLLSSFPTT
jgi:hypothetical protein